MTFNTLDRLLHGYFATFILLGWIIPNHIGGARFLACMVWAGLIITTLMRRQHSQRVQHRFRKVVATGFGATLPLVVAAMLWSETLSLFDDWRNGDYRVPRAELLYAAFTLPAAEQCDDKSCRLSADGLRLHCTTAKKYNTCDHAYPFAGQAAQVWHYDGRVYELRVGDRVIYDYDAQIAAFENERHDLRLGMLELIFFAALPQLWLAWQYYRLGKAMPEESGAAPQYRILPRKGERARRNCNFPPPLNRIISVARIFAGVILLPLLAVFALAIAKGTLTLSLFTTLAILAAFAVALSRYPGSRYWRYRAASHTIERVRVRRIETAYPLADWQAVAVMQDKEDEWAVCLIGDDGAKSVELERFRVFTGGRTYARRYRKQVARATGLAEWEEC